MRAAKILAGILVGVVILIAVALLAVRVLVDPNDYKGRISAAVKHSTGRDLVLTGDIHLSVFPWVALELGPASLGNPPNFDHEPFLAFQHASVRVKLIPLLRRELEIGRIDLDGLDVRLRRNAEGKGNWEMASAGGEAPAQPAKKSGYGESLKELAGIHVTNGRIRYQDLVVEQIDFETGAFTDPGVVPISLSLTVHGGGPDQMVSLNAKLSVSVDEDAEQIHFAAVSLSGLASHPGSNRPGHWELSAPAIQANLKAQTLDVPGFSASYLGAQVTGRLSATDMMDDPKATGSFTLDPLSLREFLPRLGIAVPHVHDERALAQLAARSDFTYGPQGVKLEKIEIVLDETHLHGTVALLNEGAGAKALKFELGVDRIDLNRYLVDSAGAASEPKKPAVNAAGQPEKPMDADGILTIGGVRFSTFDFTSVRVTLASHDGVIRLAPTQALIDGGRYDGDTTVDERGPVAQITMDERLAGVDVSKLLSQGALKGRVSGRGNVSLQATARGMNADSVFKTLNGRFDASLTEGALEGVDLGYALQQATSLIEKQSLAGGQNQGRTKFDAFKMSAQIANGIATARDLDIASAVLKVTGQGTIALPTQALDLDLTAALLRAPKATVAEIPIKVTGTYLDPTVRPDVEALAKGALKQKLKDTLGDKLKQLLGNH